MNKILIVKTSSLGDIIQAFPTLGYLRRKFPYAQIDWVVEKPFADLVRCHPYVDRVHLIDSKEWRKRVLSWKIWKELINFRNELQKVSYDAVFDLQGNLKSGFITRMALSDAKVGFGLKTVHEKPNVLFTNRRYDPPKGVNIRDDNLLVVQGYFNDIEHDEDEKILLKISPQQQAAIEEILKKLPDMKVMVCPGSAWPNKQLTKETLSDFLLQLQNYFGCTFVFVWGNQAEQAFAFELKEKISKSIVLDRFPLPVLQNLMDKMDLVVAMDSLPLHLAGTTNTRTFSVFGASRADKFKPSGIQHLTLQGSCPYGRTFEKRCPILRSCPTGACIRQLKGAEVFAAFKNQWEAVNLTASI